MEFREQAGFRWLEHGAGHPVVLVSGLMGEPADWTRALEALGSGCRGLALALPGSEATLGPDAVERLGDEILRFFDVVGIDRTVIGGNSLGGQAALEVTIRHPDRVEGLVLTGASGLPDAGKIGRVPRRPSLEYVRARMHEVVHDPGLIPPGRLETVHRLVSSSPDLVRFLRLSRASRNYDTTDRISGVSAPVLLVWGAEDRVTPPDIARSLVQRLPNAQLVLIPRTGHAPMFERPFEFSAALDDWLLSTHVGG